MLMKKFLLLQKKKSLKIPVHKIVRLFQTEPSLLRGIPQGPVDLSVRYVSPANKFK